MSWWDELVTDDDLQKLFTAEYTGPGASELQDETSLGGKTIQEQQLSRQKFLFDKLSEATLSSYKVALRLFHRWASHQQKQEQSPAQQSWYIAHPDTKLDRFFEDVLARDGPWCSKGNTEFVASTKVMCAAIVWLRKLQPGVPSSNGSYTQAKAISQAAQMRAEVRDHKAYDLQNAGGSSKILADWEVDQLLQRTASRVSRDSHWAHKGSFSLLASVSGGLRVDDLSRLRYVNVALSQSIETQPTPNMQLLHMCMTQSKTNQTGELETVTFARHADPSKCVLGALARLVVYDLLVYQLLVVDMMRAGDCDWRAVHLLWRDPGHIMCDNNYNDIVGPLKRALEQQGLAKAAVGHLGRNTGVAKLVELGFPLSLMKIWGRWFSKGDALESSYLPKALLKDLETAAQLAGHGPEWRTQHYLGRQMVIPPDHWIDAVMPDARNALAEVIKRNCSAGTKDNSAETCLRALLQLAEMFWQDIACNQTSQYPDLRQLPAVSAILETSEYALFQRQVEIAHTIMQQQHQLDTAQRMQAGALLTHVQQRLTEVLVAVPSPTRVDTAGLKLTKGSLWGLLAPISHLWSTPSTTPTCTEQAEMLSTSNTQKSQQDRKPAVEWREQKQLASSARREAPPLFSSKLKLVAAGWAEWQGLRTGRPAVKQLLQQISEDASLTLGRSNSNAKWLRVWLLRAMDAAMAANLSEAEALVGLQAVADNFTPRLTYLELLTAIAIMTKHQHSKAPEKQEAVKQISVADMLREFERQHLAVPAPLSHGETIDCCSIIGKQSCEGDTQGKHSRKRNTSDSRHQSNEARVVKTRSAVAKHSQKQSC